MYNILLNIGLLLQDYLNKQVYFCFNKLSSFGVDFTTPPVNESHVDWTLHWYLY